MDPLPTRVDKVLMIGSRTRPENSIVVESKSQFGGIFTCIDHSSRVYFPTYFHTFNILRDEKNVQRNAKRRDGKTRRAAYVQPG